MYLWKINMAPLLYKPNVNEVTLTKKKLDKNPILNWNNVYRGGWDFSKDVVWVSLGQRKLSKSEKRYAALLESNHTWAAWFDSRTIGSYSNFDNL